MVDIFNYIKALKITWLRKLETKDPKGKPILFAWFPHFCHLASFRNYFPKGRKEGNVLFNDALNTFYLWLYGVRLMVKYHTYSERGNPLPPHGLLFTISSKGYFICTIPREG